MQAQKKSFFPTESPRERKYASSSILNVASSYSPRTLGNGSYFLLRVQRYKVRDSYTIFFDITYQQEIKYCLEQSLYP